jgi:cupin 2 domain-containing protein
MGRRVVVSERIRSPLESEACGMFECAMLHGDLAADIPDSLADELITPLLRGRGVRVERIVSRGHRSPPGFWYDQDENELVLVIAGEGRLEIEGLEERTLRAGQWLEIPAHVRHRVSWTPPDRDTIWLAVFYDRP